MSIFDIISPQMVGTTGITLFSVAAVLAKSRQEKDEFDDSSVEKQRKESGGKRQVSLKGRLVHAGLYNKNAEAVFGFARIIVLGVVLVPPLYAGATGAVSTKTALIVAVILGILGTMAPSFWLDRQKKKRQSKIRRSLPDGMDLLNVCMAGGLSLPASLVRVGRELITAHPLLSSELAIAERENLIGTSTGQTMRSFADRFDMEELRSLAGVIVQTEKFGGSVTQALVIYSETMRTKRFQMAETKAQRAAILIMLPTLLCIFPGIFIVILGPAAIQVLRMFSEMGI